MTSSSSSISNLPPRKPTRPLPDPSRTLSLSTIPTTTQPIQISDDSFQAIASRINGLVEENDPNKLTPLRAHYLKKCLVGLQLKEEVEMLSDKDALSTFGPPFSPSPNSTGADLPLLRFLFHHFVLTFPFLRSAPPNFFSSKVQVFFNRFLERNISTTEDRDEVSKRSKIAVKVEKYSALLLSSAISVSSISGPEVVVKISDSDRERITSLENKLKDSLGHKPLHDEFDVNVIGVRTVINKGRIRNKVHEEFLIRTKRNGVEDVFVSRRYGDFERLAETLRIEFPDEEIKGPPEKDRRGVKGTGEEVEVLSQEIEGIEAGDQKLSFEKPQQQQQNRNRHRTRTLSNAANRFKPQPVDPNSIPPVPGLPNSASTTSTSSSTNPSAPHPLAREKNRLTLRAYLRSLLSLPLVSESSSLADFLLGDPYTLTASELEDARVREGLDELRSSEASRFDEEATKRVKELRTHLDGFKEELLKPDGLTSIFHLIRSTPNLYDLPDRYLALLSWARISLASTLFSLFMGSDQSSSYLSQLKRIHSLMPYFMLRQILRISNPVSMIRGVLDLFLAQPFGGRSLAMRMVSGGLMEETKNLGEICNAVANKVEDDELCERIRGFVYAPKSIQQGFKDVAKKEGLDLITVLLRAKVEEFGSNDENSTNGSGSNNPYLENLTPLNRSQIQRAVKASRAFERYKLYRKEPGEASTGGHNHEDEEEELFEMDGWGPKPEDEDAWLYEDLHVLLKMCTRLRDKEQMIELVFEGVTSELLKDMVTIFYSPLAQVYKAANIADSLYDLQKFIDDLIKTVESCEEVVYTNPQAIVQVFIDLVSRHESKFYNFVHQVHSKGSGLFDGLMQWIELFINFVKGEGNTSNSSEDASSSKKRRGIGSVDLEICLPAGGNQRKEVMEEIDQLVVHAYRLKFQREIKMRKKIVRREIEGAGHKAEGRQVGGKNVDSWNEEDDAMFVRAAVENLGVGDVFSGEVEEADESSDEEEEEEETESSEEEEATQDSNRLQPGSNSASGRTIGHRRLASGENEDSSWRPPVPKKELPPLPNQTETESNFNKAGTSSNEQQRQDKIDRERRKKGKAPIIRAPTLKHIPEMVPLFVEMLRPLLRPARTASGSTTTSLPDSTAQVQPPLPARTGGWW